MEFCDGRLGLLVDLGSRPRWSVSSRRSLTAGGGGRSYLLIAVFCFSSFDAASRFHLSLSVFLFWAPPLAILTSKAISMGFYF